MDSPSQPSPQAVALIAAAATASGPAPPDPTERAAWMAGVVDLATALYRPAQALDAELEVFAKCRVVRGVVVEAKEQIGANGPTGRGLVVIKPTMGNHADEPDATEPMRTPWLNEPRGAALLAQAQALAGTGVECRFGKWNDVIDNGKDKGHKRGMVAWIEPLGPAPRKAATPPPAPRNGSPHRPPAPPPPGQVAETAATDLATLRNISIANRDQLFAEARDHLRLDEAAVLAMENDLYGAAGAQRRPQLIKVWNKLIDRADKLAMR